MRASLIAQLVQKSACNAGESVSVSGSGRSAGEVIGYPLQYPWASLVAQLVENESQLSGECLLIGHGSTEETDGSSEYLYSGSQFGPGEGDP